MAGSDGRQEAVTQAQSLYKVFDAIERPPPLATSDSDHSGAEAETECKCENSLSPRCASQDGEDTVPCDGQ